MLMCALQLPFSSTLHVIGYYDGEGLGVSSILEYVQPKVKILLNKLQFGHSGTTDFRRWEEDFACVEFTNISLFNEQLWMVVQYGFCDIIYNDTSSRAFLCCPY
jgi:uncharacterized membrane protein YhdT